jgi:hypothetical protein
VNLPEVTVLEWTRMAAFIIVMFGLGCSDTDQVETVTGEHPLGRAVVVIPDSLVCPECSIAMTEIALLGGPEDPASPREDAVGRGCMVGQLSDGSFVSSAAVGGGGLFFYASSGELQRVVGRRGAGPGEFGEIVRLAVGVGDSLYVMDDSQSRMQVLAPDDRVVRTFQVPGRFRDFAILSDGRMVFHSTPFQQEDLLYHLLLADGTTEAAFGTTSLEEVDLETRLVVPGSQGSFWTASIWSYEIRRFQGVEETGAPLEREAQWFPPDAGLKMDYEAIYETIPPPPILDIVHEDDAGRLWTAVLVPDPGWERGIPFEPRYDWFRRTFDTVFEVLDPETARVLARSTHDSRYGKVCGSSLLYQVIEMEDGDTRIRVLQPMLTEG